MLSASQCAVKPTRARVMMLSRDVKGRIQPGRKAAVVLVSATPTHVLTEPLDRPVAGEKPDTAPRGSG